MIEKTRSKFERVHDIASASLWAALVTGLTVGTVSVLGTYTPEDWMWIWTGAMDCSTESVVGTCGVAPIGLVAIVLFWAVIVMAVYTAQKRINE